MKRLIGELTCSRSFGAVEGSSSLLFVSVAATMKPSSSTPTCSFRHCRRAFELFVPVGVPLTGTRDFESFRVDDQMERAIMRSGETSAQEGLAPQSRL